LGLKQKSLLDKFNDKMMRKQTRFILTYNFCFIVLAVLSVIVFDNSPASGKNEMVGFVLWGCVFYALIAYISWGVIDRLTSKIVNTKLWLIVRFFSGLLILHLLSFLGGGFLLMSLVTGNPRYGNFNISLGIHIIYIISFSIASIGYNSSGIVFGGSVGKPMI
jgi:hypothetical protein